MRGLRYMLLARRFFVQRGSLRRMLVLLISVLLFSMSAVGFTPTYASAMKNVSIPAWHTFHDPIYGFSLNYPGTWSLATERDGSHITLLNPVTRTTVSPLVTTQIGTAAAVLKHASPTQSVQRQTRLVAGHQSIDYLLPFVPQGQGRMQNSYGTVIGGPQQTRQVVIPVTNTAGTTNVYTFLLTQPTSAMGKISAAEQADQRTFEAILNSFTLPTNVVAPHMAVATTNAAGCDRVCWADANVYFADYTAVSTVGSGDGQPNYQCAEFVARAVTQDGMVPGLNNGGANGNYTPASDQSSYGSYGSKGYDLLDVGVTGITGLHDYLTDSGLATNIGQDTSQAQPGDVIFFNNGSGTDYYHTMIIVAVINGNIYMDGHNAAQYHALLTSSDFDIYHFKQTTSTNFISSNGSGGSALQVGYLPADTAQLDVFASGKDNSIWDLYKTGGANSSWSSWGSDGKPAGVQFGKLSVGTFSDGRLNLFATGSDGQVWNRYKQTTASTSQWSGWGALGQAPVKLTGQVQVGTLPNGAMYLFVLGSDNNVWSIYKTGTDTNSAWSGWGSLGNSGVQFNQLSVGTFSDGRLNLFATGSDGQVWNRYKQTTASTSQWSGWGALGQAPTKLTGQVQVGTLPNGAMYLFVLGSDNNVWSIYKTGTDTNSAWSGWGSLGNSGVQFSKLSVGTFSDGRLNLFATGSDGQVWNRYKQTTDSNSQWSGWGVLGQAPVKLTGQVQVGTLADGRIYLFVVGSDNSLWGNYKTSTSTNSAWSGWASSGQPAGSGGLIQ